MLKTIISWTFIILVVAGYVFYTKKSPPAAQKIASRAKSKASAITGSLLDVDTSGTEKKKKGAKKDKKQKSAVGGKDLQVPKVTLESESNDNVSNISTIGEDKGSLQRLAGLKSGQNKPLKAESKAEKKTGKNVNAVESSLTPAPVSPSLGAISSTSSTAGVDGDIDEPDSVDEYQNIASDMLEVTPGPSVMRITPAQDEFTTVSRRKGPQSEKKEGPTPLQKKNQKKAEIKKELRKSEREDQLRRLEAHKKEQRVAREAEAAKNPKKSSPTPASSAWTAANAIPSQSTPSTASAGLLDTFDSNSSKNLNTPPSSSDIESNQYAELTLSEEQRSAIPQEVLAEYLAERREAQQPEKEWVEVKKPRREKKKQAITESETDSDANRNPAALSSTRPAATSKPQKQFSEQDLRIPSMPAMESSSNGWDAHAW